MKATVTILVFCVAALLAVGMVMLYSSSAAMPASNAGQVGARYLVKQLAWCGLGVVSCSVIASMDYRRFRKLAFPLFGITVAVVALVLMPSIGSKINGARRWFEFHGVRFQPSELAKIALVMMLAWYCERNMRQMRTWKRGIVIPCALMGALIAPIFIEPDRGTSILLSAVGAGMLVVSGVKLTAIIPPVFAGAAALVYSLMRDPMRAKRIFSWLYVEENKSGVGYQAYQAKVALGAGGWTGLGLGNGRQKLGFVPENHTDFILSVIGEELGLVATLLIVLAFIVIVLCGVRIAWKASDPFGALLATGVTFLIGLQAFINIGVATSALPNKGLPLPFISYGGSSLLVMLTCVGLLLSVARRAREPEEDSEAAAEIKEAQLS